MIPNVPTNPTSGGMIEWARKVATAINTLIRGVETPRVGQVRYEAGALQWWDGAAWQSVP